MSGFPFRTPAFCSVSRGRRRLGEKDTSPFSDARHTPPQNSGDAGLCPWIIRETPLDLVFVLRAEDEKNVRPFLQRPSEAHEPLGLERVHERLVSLPVLLLLERQSLHVRRTIAANDHKQMLHDHHAPWPFGLARAWPAWEASDRDLTRQANQQFLAVADPRLDLSPR